MRHRIERASRRRRPRKRGCGSRGPISAALAAASLLLGAAAGPLEAQQETRTGWLTVQWGDPEPGVAAPPVLEFRLTREDGVTERLFLLDEVLARAGGLLAVQNRRVSVDLLEVLPGDDQLLPPGADRIATAVRLAPDVAEPGAKPGPRVGAALPPGAKPWISIPCRFSDIATEPKDQTYFQDQLGDDPGELNHFWKSESYDKINIDGSVAQDWLGLPSARSSYVPNEDACLNPALENADLTQLFNDCTAAHDSTVNFSQFFGINLMFNGDLDGCAWGGSRYTTLDGETKSWPVTWNPPFGYLNNSTFEHENGHGYGLPHSTNWDGDGYPYDNKWDYMSNDRFSPGANPYGFWGTGGMAWHKEVLGWLDPAEIYVAAPGVQTIDLDPLGAPGPVTGKRLIKIALGTGHWWTVEARHKSGTYEGGIPDTAVLISEVLETRTPEPVWVYDAKVPPADSNGNEETMWKVGETFTDAPNEVTVEVLQALASGGFRVRVTTAGMCTADSFEPDSELDGSDAKPVTSGVTKNHSICPLADDDFSVFTLTEKRGIVAETSGGPFPEDTRMWLKASGPGLPTIEFNDDIDVSTDRHSRIDRLCGVDELQAGTYYLHVDEFADDAEILSYNLDLTTTPCPCPATVTFASQTLTGTQTHQGTTSATLGTALIVDATGAGVHIRFRAPTVLFLDDVEIRGTFSAGNHPVCAP